MLKLMVGDVDMFSAAVLVAMSLAIAAFSTTWIARRRSRREIANEHELAKIKQADATQLEQARVAESWAHQNKKLEQGLITSHREGHSGINE